jgi:hypothetical protein
MDLLFEDRFKRKLIIELEAGPIKDEHIGQIISYQEMLLSADDPTIRIMLVGTRVPPTIKRSLDHYGIAWREISHSGLKSFLMEKKDDELLLLFEEEFVISRKQEDMRPVTISKSVISSNSISTEFNTDELIALLKSSELYINFHVIINRKKKNEDEALNILVENSGFLTRQHLGKVFKLIDEAYPYIHNGKPVKGPWFGRLIKLNAPYILKENEEDINKWFQILTDSKISVDSKINILKKPPFKLNKVDTGFITLMLYLFNRPDYLIWFGAQHKGLGRLFPELGNYSGNGAQYLIFNDLAIKFMKQYGFEPEEMDWIFSTGLAEKNTKNYVR